MMDSDRALDVFVGGGGDDLPVANLGVLRSFAQDHAKRTGRLVRYVPNARVGRVVDLVRAAAAEGRPVNLIGHSYGGPDVWRAAQRAHAAGFPVRSVITLDAVSGPLALFRDRLGHRLARNFHGMWLDVQATAQTAHLSNRLPYLFPLASKPAALPFGSADHCVHVDADHADVGRMMRLGGADAWLGLPGA